MFRNINDTPVLDNHLVMADESSITKPDDVVVRDQVIILRCDWSLVRILSCDWWGTVQLRRAAG